MLTFGSRQPSLSPLWRNMILSFLLLAVMAVTVFCSTTSGESANHPNNNSSRHQIKQGKGSFRFESSNLERALQVFYYRPEGDVKDMPILFVMHGTLRNAMDYRDNWVQLANEHNILVITPEFGKNNFPGSRGYNLGNMFDKDGDQINEELWAYSQIEPIYDEVLELTDSNQISYDLFGHSAGSQFAHRFILFKDDLRVNRVVSANAGWYTVPDFEMEFPYGLEDTELDKSSLEKRFENKLVIQLGENDTNPDHKYLRTTAEAMKQGKHRYERGHYFYEESKQFAEELEAEFNWEIRTVPGVGHNNAKMAIDVAKYLYGE